MEIYGKERKFLCTVEATMEISNLCKDGNIENLMDLFDEGNISDKINNIVDIVYFLNKGYEKSKAFEEPGYVADYLSKEAIKTLPLTTLTQIEDEAIEAISIGMGVTVETEPETEKN